ncbi:hypothetical protein [Terrabacter sp. Ter38]|uniref:hypothetical protein n=1 Tax=Terrabacter sp. Ter38 TaxID=2926030 RepID=UPI0021182119|nr:hypothetical protein [Terrabacter sp. Ter38]
MAERLAYTVAGDATEPEVGAVCEAALVALWTDLAWFEIDLSGLGEDPVSAHSVAALEPRRRKRLLGKRLESSAHLEPGPDDALLSFVVPLPTRTIGSTGIERQRSKTVFVADDQGTAAVFYLTGAQADAVQEQLEGEGWRKGLMIPAGSR